MTHSSNVLAPQVKKGSLGPTVAQRDLLVAAEFFLWVTGRSPIGCRDTSMSAVGGFLYGHQIDLSLARDIFLWPKADLYVALKSLQGLGYGLVQSYVKIL